METTEGSTVPESTEAPAGGGAEQQLEQGLDNQPKPPRYAPAPGLRHAYDAAQKIWRVERDPNFKEDGTPASERGEQKPPTTDAKPGAADEAGGLQLGEHLPSIIRDDPQASEHLAEVSAALDDTRIVPQAKQRLVDLAMELHAADLDLGVNLWNREANEGVLKQRWGAAYGERVARAQAAAKALGPKFLAWCDRTQAGNSPALLETLALMTDNLLGLSPQDAAAKLKGWRSDPKHPLRQSLHAEHAMYVARARALAILAEGTGGRQGNVEELVKDRTAKEPAGDSPEAKIDAELRQLRLDPAYMDKSKPNHKAVIERVRELYRQRYPD